ncbi:MAG: VWA domain-containing protein [Betaproteobacteria bacterium]|nr:MAG: VWA domain-containing protein [Betaproteobacteria bacterium]
MIQLAYPLALVSLVAIPLVLALHLLRPRRRRVVLSTIAVWQAALRDREGGHGFRRLLRNLSLLLLLATALVLGLALTGPQWLTSTANDADIVLVLDVSASMKSRSGIGSTRFDQALAVAASIVDGLPRNGRALVMTSGRKALLRTGFETDRGALRRALAQLRPGDEAGRPREALALALSLVRGRSDSRIYFLTDGAFDPDVDPGSPQVVFRVVGEPARNVAITRFDLRQERASDDRFQVLLTVRNYTGTPVTVPAAASLNGRELFKRTLELAAQGEQTLVLPFAGRALGEAMARIELDDDLAADNLAYAALNSPASLRVLLLSRGNFYLESVLAALPNTEVVKREAADGEDIAQLARSHDVVVFDGVAAPELPPGNFLLVDTVAPGLPFADAGRVTQPRILGSGPSALMRNVDLAAVQIDEARRVAVDKRAPGLQHLFWSAQTDLALALIDESRKLVYLGFDLAGSNFPLQAAFPLFVSQSLEWLRPRADDRLAHHVAAGSAISLYVPAGEKQVIVRGPSGKDETLEAIDGTLVFDATASAGIYRYSAGNVTQSFAVSLADARESDVNRRWSQGEQRQRADTAGSGAQALLPLWPYLLVLALVLLTLEWFVWAGSRSGA